jgi:LAGLIDADG endonuclease
MSTGVSDKLLSSFNSFSIEVTGKPLSVSNPTLTPLSLKDLSKNWRIGFTDAEGCFYLSFRANRKKDGYWTGLAFTITQHSRYLLLFKPKKRN